MCIYSYNIDTFQLSEDDCERYRIPYLFKLKEGSKGKTGIHIALLHPYYPLITPVFPPYYPLITPLLPPIRYRIPYLFKLKGTDQGKDRYIYIHIYMYIYTYI
jgi:hypothetical protein